MKARAQITNLVLLLSITLSSLAQVQVARITIKDPGMAGAEIPVRLDIKPGIVAQDQAFILYETGQFDAENIPAQICFGLTDQLSWVYTSNGNSNSTRTFELVKDTVDTQQNATHGNTITHENATLNATINDTTFVISKNDKAILQYRHALLPPIDGESDKWARSGFIHPLYSPSGEVLTWVQPPDHLHHMGLWNPWTKVSWKGVHTDFWNLGLELGTVKFKNLIALESGAVFAEIRVVHDHVAFVANEMADTLTGVQEYNGHGFHPEGKKSFIVMNEEWIIRVWNISDGYLLDFTSLITNVTDEPISLDAYRYGGGLGYRATKKWNNTNSKVLTSEGKTWKNGDATRAKWCWVSGDLNGIETGLLFMSDPGNYDFPQPMRIWPDNSNGGVGNQYFEFTPIRENAWVLQAGKTYSQRYRIWVQEGELNADQAENAWKAYANTTEANILYIDKPQ